MPSYSTLSLRPATTNATPGTTSHCNIAREPMSVPGTRMIEPELTNDRRTCTSSHSLKNRVRWSDRNCSCGCSPVARRTPGARRRSPVEVLHKRALRKRSALPITETELRLMAAAAMIGDSSRPNTG